MVSNTGKNISLDVKLDEEKLLQVEHAKYLGIHIDHQLNWNQQISQLCKVVGNKLYLLRKLKDVLPKEALVIVYKSCIQPVIDYCDTVWDVCGSVGSKRAQSLQNQAARIITGNFDYINTR